eukprot:2478512-Rhodomonas_salina.1
MVTAVVSCPARSIVTSSSRISFSENPSPVAASRAVCSICPRPRPYLTTAPQTVPQCYCAQDCTSVLIALKTVPRYYRAQKRTSLPRTA